MTAGISRKTKQVNARRVHYVTGDIFVRRVTPQTLKAWEPFWDTVGILFEFQNSDLDDEHPEWRIHWIAGVALLRTIGHVLAKVDSCNSDAHNRAISALWKKWKNAPLANGIFWEFIEKERNNLLKTYTFGASIAESDSEFAVVYENGEDAMELYREAVYWWRHQLESLEKTLRRL